jgi:hypothetical protein
LREDREKIEVYQMVLLVGFQIEVYRALFFLGTGRIEGRGIIIKI